MKKLALVFAGAAALVAPIVVALAIPPAVEAQSQSAAAVPKFEVASIRPCEDGDVGRSADGTQSSSPGRLVLRCQTVLRLIQQAYVELADGHIRVWPPHVSIEGGPAWIDSSRYRIEAKPESPQSRGMMSGPMLQAVLEDRFKLKLHRETREVPVYALTVAKGGPKLQPFREGSCAPFDLENPPPPPESSLEFCGMSSVTAESYDLYRTTLADFSTEFSSRLGRPVIDRTGIAGMFNIHLDLSYADLGYPDPGPRDPAASATPPDPSLIADAVRSAVQKLGLKLDPAKGPGEFLVIDSVERPTGN